jgi:hypothetical protein
MPRTLRADEYPSRVATGEDSVSRECVGHSRADLAEPVPAGAPEPPPRPDLLRPRHMRHKGDSEFVALNFGEKELDNGRRSGALSCDRARDGLGRGLVQVLRHAQPVPGRVRRQIDLIQWMSSKIDCNEASCGRFGQIRLSEGLALPRLGARAPDRAICRGACAPPRSCGTAR